MGGAPRPETLIPSEAAGFIGLNRFWALGGGRTTMTVINLADLGDRILFRQSSNNKKIQQKKKKYMDLPKLCVGEHVW